MKQDACVKRGTTPSLEIEIEKLNDIANVKKIEFIFKARKDENAQPILKKNYPDDVRYQNDIFILKLSESETRLFPPASTVYMDTRIIFKDGSIPKTEIAEFTTGPTLFKEMAI